MSMIMEKKGKQFQQLAAAVLTREGGARKTAVDGSFIATRASSFFFLGIKRPLDEEDVDVVGIKQPFSLEEDLDVMIVPDPAGSPPELEEEEEDMAAKRRKRNRSVFSVNQLKQLEDSFKANPYPDKLMRDSLAAELDMTEKKVNVS